MSTPVVTWAWDSLPTQVTTPLGSLHGRVLTTTLGTALLYRSMTEDYLRRLENATVVPEGTGWKITGTNIEGNPESWFTEAVAPGAKPCGCGSR